MAESKPKVDFESAMANLRKLSGTLGQDFFDFLAGSADHAMGFLRGAAEGATRGVDVAFGNVFERWVSHDGGTPATTHVATVQPAAVTPVRNVEEHSYTPAHTLQLAQGQGFSAGQLMYDVGDFGTGNFAALCTSSVFAGAMPSKGAGRGAAAVGGGGGMVA